MTGEQAKKESTFAQQPGAPARFRPYSGIMWLASYPRSGNTWTRIFLHNLFRVVAGERGPMVFDRLRRFAPWEKSAFLYRRVLGQPIQHLSRSEIAALRPKLQEAITARVQRYVFMKTHSAKVVDCGAPVINPAAYGGAVYIVRNPLDIAVSYARHLGFTIDKTIGIMEQSGWTSPPNENQLHEIIGSWSQNVASWTAAKDDKLFVLRYEDAVTEPFEAFGKLAHHVGLKPDRIQLGLAVEFSAFSRLQQQESETAFPEYHKGTDKHFRTGRAGDWQEQLTTKQVDLIVGAHGEQMRRFGYLP
jgi:hypothetical protein